MAVTRLGLGGFPRAALAEPSADTQVNAKTASITWAAQRAAVAFDVSVTAKTATVTWAAQKASVALGVAVSAKTASITWAAQKASVGFDVGVTAKTASITWAAQKAGVVSGTAVNAKTASITWAAQKASLAFDVGVTAKTASITWAAQKADASFVEPAAPSVTLGGTALNATQEEIREGGKTITLTLVGDTWTNPISGSAISGGFVGDGGSTGWQAVALAQLFNSYAGIVRTSDTVVTITLPAVPDYEITSDETITVTVPGSQRSDIESDDLDGGAFRILAATATSGGWPRSGRWPRPTQREEETEAQREARVRAAREQLGIVEKLEELPEPKKPSRASRKKREGYERRLREVEERRLLLALEQPDLLDVVSYELSVEFAPASAVSAKRKALLLLVAA